MSLPTPKPKEVKSAIVAAAVTPAMRKQVKSYARQHGMSEGAALRFIIEFFFTGNFQKSKVDSLETEPEAV